MLDKDKLISFLEREIDSCRIVGNASDQAIALECQRIIERINAGLFDSEDNEMKPDSIEFETYRKCVRGDI